MKLSSGLQKYLDVDSNWSDANADRLLKVIIDMLSYGNEIAAKSFIDETLVYNGFNSRYNSVVCDE